MLKIGAHQSISGGLDQALVRVKNIGGNCLQLFSSSPRGWSFAKPTQSEIDKFIKIKNQLKIDPIYFHATYLINLADSSRIGQLSKQSLINELNLASKLQVRGSIIHLGSYKNEKTDLKYKILVSNIKEILEKTSNKSFFIIENSGNKKIGQSLEEISQIIKDVNNKRVRVCLDTCHLFSSGYKFANNNELNLFLDDLDKLNITNHLEVWHVNDSRDDFDSGHDRHDNIGQGKMNSNEFLTLLNHSKTKNFPFIIETPGFDGNGPDKKNIDILKKMIR